jgi:hypothetical protein
VELFARSAPLRLAVVVVIALAVRYFTHTSWFAMALLVTYFVAKEIAGIVLRTGPAAALLKAKPRLRVAAFAFDNLAFLTAIAGLFMMQKEESLDQAAVLRFAAFESAVIVFVAAWGVVAAVAFRRAAGTAKV